MKIKFNRILRIRYLLIGTIVATFLFFLLNDSYLYKNGEYFSTIYTQYNGAHQFCFLPDEADYHVVTLSQSDDNTRIVYRNLETKGYKEIYQAEMGINRFSFFQEIQKSIYQSQDKVYTILAKQGSYYLYELYSRNNFDYTPQYSKLYEYKLYNELLKKDFILDNIIFKSLNFQNSDEDYSLQKSKDGYHLYLSKSFYISLTRSIADKLDINEIPSIIYFAKFKKYLEDYFNKSFEIYDILQLLEFFPRNNYYNHRFFSKENFKNYGFLVSKIVGELDINQDGHNELIINFMQHRWTNDLLIAYDVVNRAILWKKEFTTALENLKIQDIDHDGIKEILISSYAPGMEMSVSRFRNFSLANSKQSFFTILDNYGNIKVVDSKPLFVKMPEGFYGTRFIVDTNENSIIMGLKSPFDPEDKNLLKYNYSTNKLDTLDIIYQNLLSIRLNNDNIEIYNLKNGSISRSVYNSSFKIVEHKTNSIYYKCNNVLDDIKLCNNNLHHFKLGRFADRNLNIIFDVPYKMSDVNFEIRNNDLYFIDNSEKDVFNLSKLHFEKNKKINPFFLLLVVTELLILTLYILFSQIILVPISSPNKNYFIIYNFLGKLYYWKLIGRAVRYIKLPSKISKTHIVPNRVLNELTEAPVLIYKKSFLLFIYLVYEIKSRDESEIIQRISHNMKNQVLMMKLLTDQYASKLAKENQSYVDQISSSLQSVSSDAQTLSNFSHIDKMYKEEVNFNSYIQQLILNHLNHENFDNINYKPFSEEIELRIDKNLFRIAFDNLLNNALDEIIAEQKIEIVIEQKKGMVKLIMANPYNNGNRDHEEFVNIGYSSKSEGSGIGLPIAKVIIERHEGFLEYQVENDIFNVKITLPLHDV